MVDFPAMLLWLTLPLRFSSSSSGISKGSSSPGFYDILCMGWYMLVICWYGWLHFGVVWLFVWYILIWYVWFPKWHTREIFTSVPCLEITYTISKYIKQMGMTSSTNAILDSKNTHFCVIHCPVFIHGHWYLLKKSKIAGKWMCNPQRQVNV